MPTISRLNARHLFPQLWAMDAFIVLIARDAGLAGITRQLAGLAAFAAVLFALAVWRLRKALIGRAVDGHGEE